jgi:hypothetical protein
MQYVQPERDNDKLVDDLRLEHHSVGTGYDFAIASVQAIFPTPQTPITCLVTQQRKAGDSALHAAANTSFWTL